MDNYFSREFKKVNKKRTLSLLGFALVLAISPFMISQSDNLQDTRNHAFAQTSGDFTIYGAGNAGDNISSGWTLKSIFNSSTNLRDAAQKYAGTNSISWTALTGFDELVLRTPTAFDISKYQYLNFALMINAVGQNYTLAFVDAGGKTIGTPANLAQLQTLVPGKWATYTLPVSQLNAGTTQVYGVRFKEANGGAQPVAYFDEIAFTANQPASSSAQPSISGLKTGVQAATPPQKDYYPQADLLIFIIPLGILFLVIFFA